MQQCIADSAPAFLSRSRHTRLAWRPPSSKKGRITQPTSSSRALTCVSTCLRAHYRKHDVIHKTGSIDNDAGGHGHRQHAQKIGKVWTYDATGVVKVYGVAYSGLQLAWPLRELICHMASRTQCHLPPGRTLTFPPLLQPKLVIDR